ncbi:MAG: ABC transporter permease [Vicinamibacteria bacterium]|jgi:ABC-type polysaccharide/polyol phosphate export permease|nr:ABC transporter permease [Vicinamibacteria bacterium]
MLNAIRTQINVLYRYRLLIYSLVARELKARYRGSLLGFFWSFINPLLLLLTYWLIFTQVEVFAGTRPVETTPFYLFLFCGILPWTWFNSSIAQAATVLISGGNLIKKVLFPAEILPMVTVFANMAHFLLGFPILLAFLIFTGKLSATAWLVVLPLLVQLILTLGLALLISALTVHFRDIQDLLTHLLQVWFFMTPVIYFYGHIGGVLRKILRLNPMTHIIVAYQETLFHGSFGHAPGLLKTALVAVLIFALGAFLFERLRDTLAEEV